MLHLFFLLFDITCWMGRWGIMRVWRRWRCWVWYWVLWFPSWQSSKTPCMIKNKKNIYMRCVCMLLMMNESKSASKWKTNLVTKLSWWHFYTSISFLLSFLLLKYRSLPNPFLESKSLIMSSQRSWVLLNICHKFLGKRSTSLVPLMSRELHHRILLGPIDIVINDYCTNESWTNISIKSLSLKHRSQLV